MTAGRCNCNAVSFEIEGDIKQVVNCHCSFCRGMNGSSFSTYAVVLASDFNLKSGELSCYGVTENAKKYFCGQCGSPIYNSNPKYAGLNMVYLGALESHQSIKADVNIFTDSQVEWLSDLHELPSFAQGIKS